MPDKEAIEAAVGEVAEVAGWRRGGQGRFVEEVAKKIGVSGRTIDRSVSRLGLRGLVREGAAGDIANNRPLGRLGTRPSGPPTPASHNRFVKNWLRTRGALAHVDVSIERDGAAEYMSLSSASGDMVTISVPQHCELLRMSTMVAHRTEKDADEYGEFIGEIQVTSASQSARIKRLEAAIWKVCGQVQGHKVFAEADNGS